MPRAAIALGSNLANPAENVRKAIHALHAAGDVSAVSRLYRSAPWGIENQPDFINAVALIDTNLQPRALLRVLQKIEVELGRVPTYEWGPRVIDLDIIYYEDVEIDEPGLTIPHPHYQARSFVLVPLAEIDERYVAAAAGLPS
ncbi:MAG: 2-amino-4-hydroxy-6-hydroxymethyldihydropteridine diphosphokinase, partial [Candidatus Eremiobacteraeota bacterium]|nr:2-amino-4-hydroxy-6-hydroxymethyldihydropteridine diphosphokinase [Candidatus Eremiobacteraeota bacterium]